MSEAQQTNETKETFQEWSLVELFGHSRIVGHVTEQSLAGVGMIRVEVPASNGNPAFTRFFHPNAIYSLSPIGETEARALLISPHYRNEPVKRYELPQIADATTPTQHEEEPEQFEEDDEP